MEKIENEHFEMKDIINGIRGDVLVEEEERKKLENKIEKKFQQIYDSMGKVCTKEENIGIIQDKLAILEEKLDEEMKSNSSGKGSFEKNDVYNTKDRNNININKNMIVNKEKELIVNADVILITTSNGKKINTDILDHKSSTQNFICYTLDEVKEFCQKVKVEKQPRKVLFHCGNNDLDKEDIEVDILKNEIKDVVEILRQLFRKSQIIISSLFPRGEGHLEEIIKDLNLYMMEELTSIIPNSIFMNNKEIKKKMLQNDNKHLKKEGFFIFVSNIKIRFIWTDTKTKII